MKKSIRVAFVLLFLSAQTIADAPFYVSNFVGHEFAYPIGCQDFFGACPGPIPP